jgi:demethoxyubiquinone hydroxylase (CLK1/Coq7/Cat5 family)
MELLPAERPQAEGFDQSVIRPQILEEEFRLRGEGMSRQQLRGIRKALRSLHTLETMAATLYRFQIRGDSSELDLRLIVAMCNEMTHIQDFQVKLLEYGLKPSRLRWAFWVVGLLIGSGSRLLGPRAVLRTASWVERKAVRHYEELLEAVEWEEDERRIIAKDRADEEGHVSRWQHLLGSG